MFNLHSKDDLFHPSEDKPYLCEYRHEGATWSVEIHASSFEDAENRLKALSRGKVLGEIKLTIPVMPGWFAKAVSKLLCGV